eukprot:TRINITY_DN43505_c0_g1_i1.p1 TRINITY_DN43505_c0_g1~~TRINITY_DN43505_c0_g1_i1.p1  ORF type:complete len:128 (-),score=42.68 TRINITY_DN43505_c0_g1_i1:233-616(-)
MCIRDRGRSGGKGALVMVFDDKKRTDFVTGFHKRKVKRRKQAEKEMALKAKQEKRKERMENRKQLKSISKSAKDMVADISGVAGPDVSQELEFEDEHHAVTVTVEPMLTEEEPIKKSGRGRSKADKG